MDDTRERPLLIIRTFFLWWDKWQQSSERPSRKDKIYKPQYREQLSPQWPEVSLETMERTFHLHRESQTYNWTLKLLAMRELWYLTWGAKSDEENFIVLLSTELNRKQWKKNKVLPGSKRGASISWSDWGKIFIPILINVKQMEQRLCPHSHQQTMWHWVSYFGMHTKDRLCLIVAFFIGSHVKYTNPQEVLAYILYQTAKAWRFKEENMFVVSVPVFISGTRGIVPR